MKKVIKKFWGIALVIVLLTTLLIAAAPAKAALPLQWNLEVFAPMFFPPISYFQYPSSSIQDFAVSADGMTFYVALKTTAPPDNTILMKGTMGGAVWTDLTSANNNRLPATITSTDFVAISPDNPDIVIVVDATPGAVRAAASNDGGLNFSDMGTIQGVNIGAITQVFDLDVSPVSANNIYYVALAGTTGANSPAIYYYNFGAAVGAWREAVNDFGTAAVTPVGAAPAWLGDGRDNFRGIQFSKQFGSDFTLTAVSENVGAGGVGGAIDLHMLSLSSNRWDNDVVPGYPVELDSMTAAGTTFVCQAAANTMGPDFMGIEEETVINYVGASVLEDGVETGGIYRVDETEFVTDIRPGNGMNSIAYDGGVLAAGSYDTNNVWRVLDTTVNQPVAASARSLKRIGVDDAAVNDMVVVHYAGDTLYGTKMGDASALSRSTDYGNTWNDFYFNDSNNTVIDDIMFSPDGSTWYMTSTDWAAGEGEASVYRISPTGTARVLCVSMTDNWTPSFMLRGIPDDPDVVYAASKAAAANADIYVTADGGLNRWSRKTTYPGANINDLCVESATVVYGATGVLVYKSTNSGSLWSAGVDTAISGGVFNMISLGDGKLVAGGGSVVFSTDGGASWTPTLFTAEFGINLYVAATGLGPTDYIFAASTGSLNVYRAPAVFFGEFLTMNAPAIPTPVGGTPDPGNMNTGIALANGVLYVMQSYSDGDNVDAVGSTDSTYIIHTMAPTIPVHSAALWGTRYPTDQDAAAALAPYTMNTLPGSALKVVTTDCSVKLYGIDTTGWSPFGVPAPFIYYFEDIISLPCAAPVLIGPENGALFDIVSPLLADAEQVNFTWTRADPQITSYTHWVALDENFTEVIFLTGVASAAPSDTVSLVFLRNVFNPGETYYWRVSATTPFSGVFSETRSFTVSPSAALVPELGSPAAGATDVSETPAFSWTPVSGCTMYEFQLSEGTAFAVPMVSEQVATTAIVPNVTLTAGKTYFWRVRALEPVESDWSAIGSFTVAVPAEPPPPPITVTTQPPPDITLTTPPPPPATTIAPPVVEETAEAYIWAIIIIGAVLVIAVIVLIVRTRRSV